MLSLINRWAAHALLSTFDENKTIGSSGNGYGVLLPCANMNRPLEAGVLTDFDLRASLTHAVQDRRLSRHAS